MTETITDAALADAILANTLPVWMFTEAPENIVAMTETGITGGTGEYEQDLPGTPYRVEIEPGAPFGGYFVRWGGNTVGEISFRKLWAGQEVVARIVAVQILAEAALTGDGTAVFMDPGATWASVV